MDGETHPARPDAVVEGPRRHHAPLPDRPDRRHQPVQLPAQPRRPQGRAGDRGGQPDRPQAAVQGPADDARRSPRSSRRPALPAGAVSILPMTRELGDRMVADDRFKLLTFTGSPVGRLADEGARRQEEGRARARRQRRRHRRQDRRPRLGRQADARRRVRLRRPGLHQRPADVRPRGRSGTRSWSGSSRVRRRSRSATRSTRRPTSGRWSTRTPRARTQRWVDEAVALGGKVAARRQGRRHASSRRRSSTDVPATAQVCSNEAFAPLVVAFPFTRLRRRDPRRSTTRSSGSRPASSRTTSARAWQAFNELEVGGVIVNDVPTYRIDHMPYGGVKDSRPRPRGPALGDRGHDRAADHGARLAPVSRGARHRARDPPVAAPFLPDVPRVGMNLELARSRQRP